MWATMKYCLPCMVLDIYLLKEVYLLFSRIETKYSCIANKDIFLHFRPMDVLKYHNEMFLSFHFNYCGHMEEVKIFFLAQAHIKYNGTL